MCYYCGEDIAEIGSEHYGLHKECFKKWFAVVEVSEFTEVIRGKVNIGELWNPEEDITSRYFLGKFRKYSASLSSGRYILKVQERDYPELPAVEYLCNQIASLLGIEVAGYYLISFYGAETFVTKNFIKQQRIETLHHMHHYLRGRLFDCSTLLEIIKEETGSLIEMERFVRLCLFDSLIGNHDRHGRNLAFIERAGKLRLAPFYDNPSYMGIEEEELLRANHSPRGKIATLGTEEPVMRDYVEEFIRLGYEETVNVFRMRMKHTDISKLPGWQYLSGERAESLRKLIEERERQLVDYER